MIRNDPHEIDSGDGAAPNTPRRPLWVWVAAGLLAAAAVIVMSAGAAPTVLVIVATAAALVVGGVILRISSNQRRRKSRRALAVEQFSDEYEFEFHERDPGDVKKTFKMLPEVTSGGTVKKVIEGTIADRRAIGFEHTHIIHTGNSMIPVVRTIYAVETTNWPRVDIRPNRGLGAVCRRLFRRQGLQLDLPEFNRRIHVKTGDPDFALTLLAPDLQRHILEKPTVTWRLIDGWLCLIYSGAMRLDRAPESLQRLERFVELTPPELEYWAPDSSS